MTSRLRPLHGVFAFDGGMMYTAIVIIFSIIVLVQALYIYRLRKAVRYAVDVLTKYERALLMDDIIRKVNDKDELKAGQTVPK